MDYNAGVFIVCTCIKLQTALNAMQLENVGFGSVFGLQSGNREGYVQFDIRLLVNLDHTCM